MHTPNYLVNNGVHLFMYRRKHLLVSNQEENGPFHFMTGMGRNIAFGIYFVV
jgi:hypothetical protein